MFRGIHNINIDAKGRLAIPTRFREQFAGHCDGDLVVTADYQNKCLLIYPLPDWEAKQNEIDSLPNDNQDARRAQRMLVGHATDIRMDGNGRILLTPPLREYASLKKKGVLIGQGKKLELWDDGEWHTYREAGTETPNATPPQELLNLSL
ncbi:MAG: division/cell wall cluster transcriptional repressor MraZ [Pseudomonadales bacterium]